MLPSDQSWETVSHFNFVEWPIKLLESKIYWLDPLNSRQNFSLIFDFFEFENLRKPYLSTKVLSGVKKIIEIEYYLIEATKLIIKKFWDQNIISLYSWDLSKSKEVVGSCSKWRRFVTNFLAPREVPGPIYKDIWRVRPMNKAAFLQFFVKRWSFGGLRNQNYFLPLFFC